MRKILAALGAAALVAIGAPAMAATAAGPEPAGAHPDIIGAGKTFYFCESDSNNACWRYNDTIGLLLDEDGVDGGPSNFKASGAIGDNYQTLTDTGGGECAAYFNSGTIQGVKYTDVINEHNCTAGGTTPNYVEWQFTRLGNGYWIVQNLWTNQNDALCAGGYEKVITDPGDGQLTMACPANGPGEYNEVSQEWDVSPS